MMSSTISNNFMSGAASPKIKDLLHKKTRSPNKHGGSDFDDSDFTSNNFDTNSNYNDMFASFSGAGTHSNFIPGSPHKINRGHKLRRYNPSTTQSQHTASNEVGERAELSKQFSPITAINTIGVRMSKG